MADRPLIYRIYRVLMTAASPFLRLYLRKRRGSGKESTTRSMERRGVASLARPDGRLVWLHAASVGESISLLALIDALLVRHPDTYMLVTTGTITSARLMEERLPERALHQFVPVDQPGWVRRFLDHWRPDLVLWAESELWPNMLAEIKERGIPAALVNARMSERSFGRWQKFGQAAKFILSTFNLCLAQNDAEADRLRRLGAHGVQDAGNLKYAAAPLPCDENELAALKAMTGDRPVWLYASTHPGEEEIAIRLHEGLKQDFANLLTIIVPRHPERGDDIAGLLSESGLEHARRSKREPPAPETEIYLADTLGEMGLFYRATRLTLIGGSMVPHGGHNPIEPGQLDCAILYGPHMFNFVSICRDFEQAGACRPVSDENDARVQLAALLEAPAACAELADAAGKLVHSREHVVDSYIGQIETLLPGGTASPNRKEAVA